MVYYSTEAVDRAIAANYESYLRMLEKSAPGAGWREVGLAVDGLPVFAAGRRLTKKERAALIAAGFKFSVWRPQKGCFNLRGWH